MPYTKKQKRLFGADLGRLEAGKKTRTGMTKAQLTEGVKAPTRPALKKKDPPAVPKAKAAPLPRPVADVLQGGKQLVQQGKAATERVKAGYRKIKQFVKP